jgi:hypothetical protein
VEEYAGTPPPLITCLNTYLTPHIPAPPLPTLPPPHHHRIYTISPTPPRAKTPLLQAIIRKEGSLSAKLHTEFGKRFNQVVFGMDVATNCTLVDLDRNITSFDNASDFCYYNSAYRAAVRIKESVDKGEMKKVDVQEQVMLAFLATARFERNSNRS